MDNEKLNSLIVEYQKTRCETTFNLIYEEVGERLGNAKYNLAKYYGLGVPEVESEMNLLIFEIAIKYDIKKGNYFHMLTKGFKNVCIDLARSKPKHLMRDNTFRNGEGGDTDLLDSIELDGITGADAQNTMNNLTYDIDQRQLVGKIMNDCDEDSRQAINAFNETNSFNKAAKLLGTCNKTVERRIRKLSTLFDGNQMGKIDDYFTVATRNLDVDYA